MAKIRVSDLIAKGDPDKVEWLLRMYQTDPVDEDKSLLAQYIIKDGLSVHMAAKRRLAEGSKRAYSTLMYHAQGIVDEVWYHLGPSPNSLIAALERNGEIYIAVDQLPSIISCCRAMGYEVVQDVRIRLVRNGG